MKKFSTIILILALAISGYFYYKSMNPAISQCQIDQALVTFVNEWKGTMESNNIKFKAGFNRIDYILIGEPNGNAGHSDKSTRTISISIEQFKAGPVSVKATLWHELGHFVYNLPHKDNFNCIMNSRALTEIEIREHWPELKASYLEQCKKNEIEGSY